MSAQLLAALRDVAVALLSSLVTALGLYLRHRRLLARRGPQGAPAGPEAAAAPPARSTPLPGAPRRVLFVDDEPSTVRGVGRLLRSDLREEWPPVEVLLATGPEEALALVRGAPVDVAVLDLRMPGMSGEELAAAVREGLPPGRRAPHFVFTSGGADLEARARAAGATSWLTKPFDASEVADVVRRLLRG